MGQTKGPDDAAPSFTPCRLLDFELEMVPSHFFHIIATLSCPLEFMHTWPRN